MLPRRLALAAALVLATPSAGAAPGAKPVLEGGDACIKAEKGCDALKVGAPFAINSDLVAGEAGAIIRLGDGSSLDLAPGASLRIQPVMPIPIGPGEPVKTQTVTLLRGKLGVNASARGKVKRAVLFKGHHKAQIIVSGEASLSLKDETLSAVNLAGKLLATTANDWTDVPVQKAFSLSKDDPKPQLRDLLPAPKAAAGRSVTTSMSDASAALTLAWSAVPRAAGYEVRVARVGGPVLRRVTLRDAQVSLGGLPVGSYEARVQAQDEGGLDGDTSPPVRLAVMGIDLPPGGFRSASSAVQVAEGQTISFTASDGVEVAYDTGTAYVPVGKGFVMHGTTPRLLRFRTPGSTLDEALRVEPRSLAATVEIGPKNARWPRDTLTITVRLVNRTGGATPPNIKMEPLVTLGVTPVQATFQDDGAGGLKATIAPQPGKLPNVIRVEVKDQYGIFLGRNFLEVSGE